MLLIWIFEKQMTNQTIIYQQLEILPGNRDKNRYLKIYMYLINKIDIKYKSICVGD